MRSACEHAMLGSYRLLWLGLQIHQEPPLRQQLHIEQLGSDGSRPPLRQRNPNLALRQRFIGKPDQQPAQHGTIPALATSSMDSLALGKQSIGRLQGAPSTAGQVLVGQGAALDTHSASSASMPPGMQLQPEAQGSWLAALHRPPPPAHAAGAGQAGGSSASSGAAGQPRAAPPGASAEAVAQLHTGPAIAAQAGAPCASSGTAGHYRAAIPTRPAAATAQRSASTAHSAAGELCATSASLAQHTEVRQMPAPTSGPGGAAPRSFGPQGCDVSQAPHRPSGGNQRQTSQPHVNQHFTGSGPGHPTAKPSQAAAVRGTSGLQAASAPAAAALHQGAEVSLCYEPGGSRGGVRSTGAPGGAMPCSTAAARPLSEPAARLQGSASPEQPSRRCITINSYARASACPALGKHALQLLPAPVSS